MKNKYAFLISLFTAFGFIFLAHGVTHAAVWPGNQWGSDTNISIKLSQNQRHPDYRGSAMYFAYYVKDGQGSKSIKFINTECGYKGKAEVTNFWAGPKINFSSGGDCGNKTLNLTDKSSMELPDGKYDVYYIVARLTNASGSDPEDKASMFKFDIEYDSNGGNNFIGYIANSDGSLPIASNRGDVYLPDIKIKISCEASGPGKINLYDSDNNKDLYAQPDDYRPMKLKINGSASYDGHDNVQGGWGGPNANDFYWPNDTTSATTRWIRYTFTPTEQQQTYLIIRDLGGNNYTSIGLPFNEYPKDCSKPKCPPPYDYLRPPFCPTSRTYNWALEATSQASQKLIIKGQSVVFTHTQKPVSIPGWTSDASTTDYVDGNIITTYNGNIIEDDDAFNTLANEGIDKVKYKYLTGNSTGRYCQYVKYPVGFLGKRQSPNYRSTGYTYRWVWLPSRPGNMTVYNPAYDTHVPPRAIGGYEQWWLASTTDDTPDTSSRDGWNQYWSFHNFDDPGADGQDGSSGIWRWYGGKFDITEPTQLQNWLTYGYRTDPGHPTADDLRHPWEVYGWWDPGTGAYNKFPKQFDEDCVDVIDPTPVVSATDYEKGSGDKKVTHQVRLNVSTCPSFSTPVTIEAEGEDGALFYSQTKTAIFGGTDCTWTLADADAPIISGALLDGKSPGYKVKYSTRLEASGLLANNSFTVFEVPFARFYGNDVYSTNGQLKFNDSNNVAFDAKGSVAQYAAFAAGDTNYLDTAGYRKDLLSPNPPTGLSSNNYPFHSSINAEKVYNDAESNLPINCPNYAGGTLPATGCFNATGNPTTINGSAYNTKTTIKGSNVVINGDISNTSFDTSSTVGATIYRHPWWWGGNHSATFTEGTYNSAQLNAKGFATNGTSDGDGISGVDVSPGGYRVTLYKGDNLTGASLVLTNDNLDLSTVSSWNNATKSLIIEKLPTANYNVDATGVLLIIADNIFINKTVERIDAILIARNAIYTCTNGTAPITNSSLEDPNNCRKTLTINGSISAPNIAFQRVGGSRYLNQGVGDTADRTSNCAAWKGIKNCGARGDIDNPSGKTAEIINFPAYLYWAQPYLVNKAGSGGTYDSLNLAPPRQ